MNHTAKRFTRTHRGAGLALIGVGALTLSGCITVNVPPKPESGAPGSGSSTTKPRHTSAPHSASPSESGRHQGHGHADYPSAGIPTEVKWPSDWLKGFTSEGVRGEIVSLDLDYEQGQWIWEVTSRDPGTDNANPGRGLEADLAADTLKVLQHREVQLDTDEQAQVKIGAAEAARLSGEKSPDVRLIELSLDEDRGAPVWEATVLDTGSGAETDLTIDANTGEILAQEADD